ncbi:Uncharacterised protein [Legionella jordanis]|nr:Uncharacterised protein [Legionella jordanis]
MPKRDKTGSKDKRKQVFIKNFTLFNKNILVKFYNLSCIKSHLV